MKTFDIIFTAIVLIIFIFPVSVLGFVAPSPGNNSFDPQSFNTKHTLPNISGESTSAQNNNANISNNISSQPAEHSIIKNNPIAKNFIFLSNINISWLIFFLTIFLVIVIFFWLKFKKMI